MSLIRYLLYLLRAYRVATVVVTITQKSQDFPAGTVAGKLRIELSSGVSQDVDGLTASFTDVAPGDYTATAQALDSVGSPLGSAVSTAFNVPVPTTVSLSVPDTITVAVS